MAYSLLRPTCRCGGLVEALRVLKLGVAICASCQFITGYPTRAPYKSIAARYGHILDQLGGASFNERDFSEGVLLAFELERADYKLGLTKVFFRSTCSGGAANAPAPQAE